MVQVTTTVRLVEPRFTNFTTGHNPGLVREGRRLSNAIVRTSRRLAPSDEGHLRQSISGAVRSELNLVIITVEVGVRYGLFVSRGTGIYGPSHARIYPNRAKAFRFQPKVPFGPLPRGKRRPRRGARAVVFAASIRGIPRNEFLVEGLEAHVPPGSVTRFI